ncbi:hypothetical protein CHLRE_11g476850v5 [Chlamydomonas reinhardtii]|uniref:Dynein regulatory complex subunit 4 n=3 Tax=Chlamydomonas reinhardtii TaxID=3055 RepID=DRC4_CHLRE|nr:uncharacterized protein CHLRE_11g476850v5 [Chlamydomonas reinhardtii]Q7XJ96.1 RecName: Full=Dynein regulatory complex subunit 4; AltName: Full=Growth arrest-specific protein 8 homolog; AltName: Full=Protein PF2 [Chlamydomonas reinhardtii]7JU4_0 Chain 0, Dynein regulatory complex subunit 4 [Chlamydomonas reinhardtii]7JU4_4 Chain 4, Dynein regulatory complex subunit 4 [Chlamydomonas reinhardtii]8GLV_EN Chain EN, Dynein regulatory complex subunit 4 [Chlamydomonas reinhardtii]8GLV_EO Chain EO, 
MAPKKKGTKKESKKDAVATGDIEGASVEELNQKIGTLEKEKNKEEEYRNYMQLERDKINAFWEITKKDLEDRRAELRNKDREMEEMEERHQVEIKVYKQKVKHLLYEHQNNITTLKSDGELALKLQQDEYRKREGDLGKDKRNLKLELKEQELAHQDIIRQLKLEHAKEITKLRQEFEQQAKDLQSKYEKKMKMLRDDMELRRKQEIHEIEERKNTHINELMKKHERAFAEIKNYYNDITHNNLDLIKTLKEDVAEMKRREAANEKLMYEIAQDNKKLSEPLSRALKEVELLRQQLANYDKDKLSLAQTKARLLNAERQIKNLEWENEVLSQRFSKVQTERDELYGKFEASIYDVQQKTGLKSALLEKKVEALGEALEMKEAQLAEVLTAANLDPGTLAAINQRLEEVLDNKNQIIKALQYDVAKVSKAHNDLIRVYEAKLTEFGIPVDELGFRPLVTNTSTGPAGLVVGA